MQRSSASRIPAEFPPRLNVGGISTIPHGETFVLVEHGFAEEPETVLITPRDDALVFLAAKGPGVFMAQRDSDIGDVSFEWRAWRGEVPALPIGDYFLLNEHQVDIDFNLVTRVRMFDENFGVIIGNNIEGESPGKVGSFAEVGVWSVLRTEGFFVTTHVTTFGQAVDVDLFLLGDSGLITYRVSGTNSVALRTITRSGSSIIVGDEHIVATLSNITARTCAAAVTANHLVPVFGSSPTASPQINRLRSVERDGDTLINHEPLFGSNLTSHRGTLRREARRIDDSNFIFAAQQSSLGINRNNLKHLKTTGFGEWEHTQVAHTNWDPIDGGGFMSLSDRLAEDLWVGNAMRLWWTAAGARFYRIRAHRYDPVSGQMDNRPLLEHSQNFPESGSQAGAFAQSHCVAWYGADLASVIIRHPHEPSQGHLAAAEFQMHNGDSTPTFRDYMPITDFSSNIFDLASIFDRRRMVIVYNKTPDGGTWIADLYRNTINVGV